jgi:proteasome assembly chaperone (PAC2) family protein
MVINIEEIQKQFQRKRETLNKSIQIGVSLMGKESPREALPALAVAVFTNLQDLYNINEISLTALAMLKDEIDDVATKNKSVEEMNKDLKKRFNATLGSLEDRLKQINDKDQSKKEEPGEFTFYG